jgi:hypothetical protein
MFSCPRSHSSLLGCEWHRIDATWCSMRVALRAPRRTAETWVSPWSAEGRARARDLPPRERNRSRGDICPATRSARRSTATAGHVEDVEQDRRCEKWRAAAAPPTFAATNPTSRGVAHLDVVDGAASRSPASASPLTERATKITTTGAATRTRPNSGLAITSCSLTSQVPDVNDHFASNPRLDRSVGTRCVFETKAV